MDACPSRACTTLGGGLRPQIGNRIDRHFEQFVAGGDGNALLVVNGRLDEYFRDRLPVLGEIVVAERARGIGVVEIDELPVRWFCRRGVIELELIAPDRQEILS